MFNLFKSKAEKLRDKHKKLLEQAFQLSKSDRSKSDNLYAQAEELMKEIEALEIK
ncbi:Lacal_2735 family protein [Jiulongibacter sp. NS-SX5]|uniref:Lacal_2735 family protein n=1 Tax=Jiulongibacter sp. NS-SX5 TaxID=3463854 RepID=UPI00405A0917